MSHSPARTFNRRTFAKGVGWAAPAVVASAAVPAYAASICEVRTGFLTQPLWGPPLLLLKFQQVLKRALAVGLF